MKKHLIVIISFLLICLSITGCGEDPKMAKFKNDIDSFCNDIAAIDSEINSIDATSESAKEQLLDCLDRLKNSFEVLAEIDIPESFSYLKDLTKEASDYMATAVESYHEAYSNNSFNEYTADYAKQNYERAYKRITVILKLLRGEDISDINATVESEE